MILRQILGKEPTSRFRAYGISFEDFSDFLVTCDKAGILTLLEAYLDGIPMSDIIA